MKPFISPTIGKTILLLFFYMDDFDIKYSTKVDMPLSKETKPNLKICYLKFHVDHTMIWWK